MAFPTATPTKIHLDQSTDSPALARSELAVHTDITKDIVESYANPSGICDLDSGGKVPAARLPSGTGSGTDVDMLDGQHGSYYQNSSNQNAGTLPAARFSDTTHGARAGGTQHALATQTVAGFMSASDKVEVDSIQTNIANAVANGTTTNAINAKTAATAVYAVGSYILAKDESNSTTTNPGGTRAGSALRPSDVESNTYGTGGSGSWRCMGYCPSIDLGEGNHSNYGTLWLRYA